MTELRPEIVAAVDEATKGNPQPHIVSARLQELFSGDALDDERPFAFAFGYGDIPRRAEERRKTHGSAFGPMFQIDDMVFPLPLDEVDEADLGALAVYLDEHDPAAVSRARMGHLLWERRFGEKPHERARMSVRAYLEIAKLGDWPPVRISDSLGSALEISLSLNDKALVAEVVDAAIKHAKAAIAEGLGPGVPMYILSPLVDLDEDQRPSELSDVLESALDRYGQDPWVSEDIRQLQAKLGGDADALNRESVELFAEDARKETGLYRYVQLRNALERAQLFGFTDLTDSLRVEIQNLQFEPSDFASISVDLGITKEEVAAFADPVLEAENIGKAILLLGRRGSPLPPKETTKREVEEEHAEHPLLHLIPSVTIGAENSYVQPGTEEDRLEDDIVKRQALTVRRRSVLVAETLRRGAERFGTENAESEIEAELIHSPAVAAVADELARAIGWCLRGEPDVAVHVGIPRIERVVRELSKQLGLPVWYPPRGNDRGGVMGLGALLHQIGQLFAQLENGDELEPYRQYLKVVLTERSGLNLRNNVSHSLSPSFDELEAAVMVEVIAVLASVTLTEPE